MPTLDPAGGYELSCPTCRAPFLQEHLENLQQDLLQAAEAAVAGAGSHGSIGSSTRAAAAPDCAALSGPGQGDDSSEEAPTMEALLEKLAVSSSSSDVSSSSGSSMKQKLTAEELRPWAGIQACHKAMFERQMRKGGIITDPNHTIGAAEEELLEGDQQQVNLREQGGGSASTQQQQEHRERNSSYAGQQQQGRGCGHKPSQQQQQPQHQSLHHSDQRGRKGYGRAGRSVPHRGA